MNNKVLVELIVPELDSSYNIYLPINRKVGNVIYLINKSLNEMTNGDYEGNIHQSLYNKYTGMKYNNNLIVQETDIKNGSCIVLL